MGRCCIRSTRTLNRRRRSHRSRLERRMVSRCTPERRRRTRLCCTPGQVGRRHTVHHSHRRRTAAHCTVARSHNARDHRRRGRARTFRRNRRSRRCHTLCQRTEVRRHTVSKCRRRDRRHTHRTSRRTRHRHKHSRQRHTVARCIVARTQRQPRLGTEACRTQGQAPQRRRLRRRSWKWSAAALSTPSWKPRPLGEANLSRRLLEPACRIDGGESYGRASSSRKFASAAESTVSGERPDFWRMR